MIAGAAGSPSAAGKPPNLVVVILDCAREVSFGTEGRPRAARTPNFDGVARGGTRFRRAVAPSNWTLPSHLSLMTGTYPAFHRLRTFRRDLTLPETIQTWLGRRGYDTALFTETLHLVGGWGLETGFDRTFSRTSTAHGEDRTLANEIAGHTRFLYSDRMRSLVGRVPATVLPINRLNFAQERAYKARVSGTYLLDDFETWLSSRPSERPFHVMFNFADGHEPYPEGMPNDGLGWLARGFSRTPRYYLLAVDALQALVPWDAVAEGYVRALERADAKLGRVLDMLRRHGQDADTLVVVTSDHGQAFGEHGMVYHGCGGTDSVTRVPLAVRLPDGVSGPSHVDDWVSLCDVPSWLKAAALGRVPYDEAGSLTVPFPVAPPGRRIVYCEAGPASDPNHSLVGLGADRSWNHRQLVAYHQERKLQLDLVTGELRQWATTEDVDRLEGERVTGADADELRRRFFVGYTGVDPLVSREGLDVYARAPLGDEQMRSWGYD